ncbi:zinc finger, CCHC-type containing protein [Tanacetum coccineum]
MKAGILRRVKNQMWVANPVMVKKSDRGWRIRVDFTDINKACPKDCYPLLEIDWKVESLSGFRLKCFLNAYQGYHQIQMAEEDKDKTILRRRRDILLPKNAFRLEKCQSHVSKISRQACASLESKNEVCLLCEVNPKQIPAFDFICASLESILAIEDTWERERSGFAEEKVWGDIPVVTGFWGGKEDFFGGVSNSDEPKGKNVDGPSVVNMVEHNNSSRDCKGVNVGNKVNGSGTKGSVDGSSNSLKDRCWFKTYESLNDGSILHMGNELTTLMYGRGCVDIRLNIVNDNIGSTFMLNSKLNDSILWHARLGLVHFKMMQDMSKDGLIPTFDIDTEKTKSRVLGAVVRLPDPKLETLGERGIKCIFVGYAEHSKAFRFYVIEPIIKFLLN